MKLITTLLFLFSTSLGAQEVAGEFSPNPAPPGVPITFTLTDATGLGGHLPNGCGITAIRSGTPFGPNADNFGCGAIVLPLAANGSYSFTWDQTDEFGVQVPNGRYWFEVKSYDPTFAEIYTNVFCISIQEAAAPALSAAGPAKVGTSTALSVDSPGDPGGVYLAVASFTSNAPISALGLELCLDLDPLLNSTLRNPNGIFTNSIGLLDGAGSSIGFTLDIPNNPSVAYRGLVVQAAISGSSGIVATNALTLTIQP